MFYSLGHKSDIRTLYVSHSSQPTSKTTRKVFIYTSYQNNVTMDDPVNSYGYVELNVSEYQTDYSNKCFSRSDVTEYSTNHAGAKSWFRNCYSVLPSFRTL